jgi:hypothetical protein
MGRVPSRVRKYSSPQQSPVDHLDAVEQVLGGDAAPAKLGLVDEEGLGLESGEPSAGPGEL